MILSQYQHILEEMTVTNFGFFLLLFFFLALLVIAFVYVSVAAFTSTAKSIEFEKWILLTGIFSTLFELSLKKNFMMKMIVALK